MVWTSFNKMHQKGTQSLLSPGHPGPSPKLQEKGIRKRLSSALRD